MIEGKKKKKKPPAPPPVGPWIYKLHLADNGIDVYDKDRDEGVGRCMQQIQKLVIYLIMITLGSEKFAYYLTAND